MKAYYDNKPSEIEAVGNGNYLFRWNIMPIDMKMEERTILQYVCEEATVKGKPEYGKLVESAIRENYTASNELALINKYNSYKQGIIEDETIETEYKEYLVFVNDIKQKAKEALETFKL